MDQFGTLYRAAAYLTGRGVSFGSPIIPPQAVNQGVYSIGIGLLQGHGVAGVDTSFDLLADGSLDHLYISPQIEAVDNPHDLLRDGVRKLKVGGHLILRVRLGHIEPGHYTFAGVELREWLERMAKWKQKAEYLEAGEYLLILKRLEGRKGIEAETPRPPKRACIARYGALGDAIIMTPLIRRLKEDGYHVTINVSSYSSMVFENNPYIDNVLIQERDLIPNPKLGDYWRYWASQYDRYINLSESVEGDLLFIEGRPNFFTTQSHRQRMCDKNYYDYTMRRGGYPEDLGTRGELFFTRAEERKASQFFNLDLRRHHLVEGKPENKFIILWALNGSSHHKVYPLMEPLLIEWFKTHPDSLCITVGDQMAGLLEFDHPQLIPKAGKWKVRESLIATKYVDLVIGPETMITNAAGCFPTPKIVLLSHSSRENLTKYFLNDFSLEPDRDTAPCYPCHQLHYTKESCPLGEMKDTSNGQVLGQAPICSISISPVRLLERMEEVYQMWKGK